LNEEIDSILETSTDNNYDILEAITSKVTKGEQQPYEAYNLLMSDADESKRNLLIGFSTAKYERLFKILENRQFDRTHVFTSNKENSRAKVSNLAAEVISKTYHNTTIEKIEANSLNETIERITFLYQKYYVDQNYNFEISLTGSKNQTVACATICAAFKVSQCWYIKPAQWDINNFSIGVGEKKYYKIRL
jgi:hypothetical protein